jgi:hypothetical protein
VAPATNRFGTAIVTITVIDGSGNTAGDSFALTVTPSNDAPTLDAISNITVNQNAGPQTVNLTGISFGPTNESQTLFLTASSSNPAMIANPTVNYTSPNSNGTLTFTPAPNGSGSVTITVTANDAQPQNNITTRTFTVSINGAPTISVVPPQTTIEETASTPIPFTVGDDATPAASLTVVGTSSNQSLVPNANVMISGTGSNRTVKLTPLPNQFGATTITLTATDGAGASSSRRFVFVVDGMNDRPTLDPIGDVMMMAGGGSRVVNITGITSGPNENQFLTIMASSSNPGLVSHPTVNYNSPNITGTLTLSLASATPGSATITVTVQDDGGTANGGLNTVTRMFTVSVVESLPSLDIAHGNGLVKLSWSTHLVGFSLEWRESLATGTWSPVPGTPTVEGNKFIVTLSDTGVAKYFHLRGP